MIDSLKEIDRLTGSVYLLRDLVQERFGLALNDERGINLITGRLADRLSECSCESFLEYYNLLMNDGAAADEEWRQIITALAKSVTSFLRHSDAIRNLVDVVIPKLLFSSPSNTLRIWSASCATGEEPLSIAMALNDAGWFERAKIEIFASDTNHTAIESAIQGVYSENRINYLDAALRDKYFTKGENGWQVVPELHRKIRWKEANLMIENEIAELAQSHVIFCNNVFIYFTGHTICKTLRSFARFMPDGAYLFTDNGEYFTSLVSHLNLFEESEIRGSSVWVKK